MRFTCCLNMGFILTMLKMSPDLFVLNYTESASARTAHYVDVFVSEQRCTDYVMTIESLTLAPFCLEKESVRKKAFQVLSCVFGLLLVEIR